MQYIKRKRVDIFTDVIEKIHSLTISQQRFIQELLSGSERVAAVPKKNLFKRSFGIWFDRKDIKGSVEYVNKARKEWGHRFERIKI